MHKARQTSFPRSLRVAEEIQRILGDVFLTRVKIAGAGLLTVTRVSINRDLRVAQVYISLLRPDKSPEEVLTDIIHHGKEIRYLLGKVLELKYVPELRFHLDHSTKKAAKINLLLENLHPSDLK
ncbi:30S ribosome-binding factor RbfA [Candidatus Neomarinimicrobiota bacterium]